MSISLQKGQKVSLSKESKGLSNVLVGLGWDAVEQKSGLFGLFKAADIDCDATAILLKNGKFTDKNDVVYFGNLTHKSGTVRHMGDNLTGDGDGDDEQILIELSRVPQEYDKIVIVVNIYSAVQRKQHFGMIRNALFRNDGDDLWRDIQTQRRMEIWSHWPGYKGHIDRRSLQTICVMEVFTG